MVTYYRNDTSSQKIHYQFCYGHSIIPTNKVEYIPINLVEDVDATYHAYRMICGFHGEFTSIKFVREAYEEFQDQLGKTSAPSEEGDRVLERRARSFFVEFGVFLTHWERYIKHTENNDFIELFEKTTHAAYDSSDDYALAIMLRNYLTHSSNVIQGKFWGSGLFDVGCNKGALLDDDFFTKAKKKIIERQPAQFISLPSVMRNVLGKLEDIYRALIKFDANEFISSGIMVSGLIEKIRDDGRRFYFVSKYKDAVYSDQGIPGHREIVGYGQYIDEFKWKDYEEDINYLLGLSLTPEEEQELSTLRNQTEDTLLKEASADPDCKPLK